MAIRSATSFHRVLRPAAGSARATLAALVALLTAMIAAPAAHADLKLCNSTSGRVGVALGYQDAKGWATEGWWNIASQTCETLLKGPVPSQFIYVYAVDYERGGEWSGKHQMCTTDKSFVIREVKECVPRGFRSTGFYEVDTGQSNDWTIRLNDPDEKSAKRP